MPVLTSCIFARALSVGVSTAEESRSQWRNISDIVGGRSRVDLPSMPMDRPKLGLDQVISRGHSRGQSLE